MISTYKKKQEKAKLKIVVISIFNRDNNINLPSKELN